MTKKHLTQKSVDSLKTVRAREEICDSSFRVRGFSFGVRLSRDGSKLYCCRYRDAMRCRRRIVLGDANSISLRAAYEKAIALSIEAKDATASKSKQPSPISKLDADPIVTFGCLCDEYLRKHAATKKDGGKKDARIIRHDLSPAWEKVPARDIERRHILKLLDDIAIGRGASIMANRTRSLISRIFSFAVEREIVKISPCVGLPKKGREESKDRFLTDDEIKTLWPIIEKEDLQIAVYFKLILLTGQRPGEVAGARWTEFENDCWTIPRERSKNGRSHRIPLSPLARKLLEDLRFSRECRAESNLWVFQSKRATRIATRRIQEAVQRLNEKSKLAHFTTHDFRRTCTTGLRRIGIPRETVSRILNHTNQSVTLVYDRYDEMPEMTCALNAWGNWISSLVSGRDQKKASEYPPTTETSVEHRVV